MNSPVRSSTFGLIALTLLSIVAPRGGSSQEWPRPVLEPARALELLRSTDPEDRSEAMAMLRSAFHENFDRYAPAQRRLILDGVEQVARGDFDRGDQRPSADARLILRGLLGREVPGPHLTELPARLLRIYHGAADEGSLRFSTISIMAQYTCLHPNHPRVQDMLNVMAELAVAPTAPDRVFPDMAIDMLLLAGPRGVRVLQRLHDEQAVQDTRARVYLRELARKDFPREIIPEIYLMRYPQCTPLTGPGGS
jgi:hypothetical protein